MANVFKDEFVPNIQTHSKTSYTTWKQANPKEAAAYEKYRDAVIAYQKGQPAPVPPVLTSKYGKAMVAAGKLQVSVTDIGSAPPASPPPTINKFAARNGSDSNPGTQGAPYLTANKLFNSLANGEVGAFRGGIYNEHISGEHKAVIMAGAGTSTSEATGIKVINYPGETVEIQGSSRIERNWVRMEGIKVNSRPWDNVRDEVWWVIGTHHYYYGCDFTQDLWGGSPYFDAKGSAVFVSGNDCTIEHCAIHTVRWDQAAGTNQPHGIYANGANNLIVKNTKFWDIGDGYVSGQFCIQLYPTFTTALIQNCIFDNVNGPVVYGDVTGAVVDKCIMSNTGYYQPAIYGLGTVSGCSATNNHYYNLGTTPFVYGSIAESGTTNGNPNYTNPAGHVYFPFTGAGTSGKGTDW